MAVFGAGAVFPRIRVLVANPIRYPASLCIGLLLCAAAEAQEPGLLINGGDGLRNAGFEQWIDGRPLFWRLSPDAQDNVRQNDRYAREGAYALEFSGNYDACRASALVESSGPLNGRAVVFTIVARAAQAESAYAFLESVDQSLSLPVSLPHPGDGRWHTLEASAVLPDDFEGRSLVVGFMHKGNGATNASAHFEKADIRIFAGKAPLARVLAAYPGASAAPPENWNVVDGSITTVDADGTSALRLAPGSAGQKPAQFQVPLENVRLDAGKTLRVLMTGRTAKPDLLYAVYGLVENNMIPLADGDRATGRNLALPAGTDWTTVETDYRIPTGLETGSALLIVRLHPNATGPALLRELRVSVADVP